MPYNMSSHVLIIPCVSSCRVYPYLKYMMKVWILRFLIVFGNLLFFENVKMFHVFFFQELT